LGKKVETTEFDDQKKGFQNENDGFTQSNLGDAELGCQTKSKVLKIIVFFKNLL
jgi:hypothetical protein